jgi:hypothetical protein
MSREERVFYVIYAHQPQTQRPVVGLLAAMGPPLHFAEHARSAISAAPCNFETTRTSENMPMSAVIFTFKRHKSASAQKQAISRAFLRQQHPCRRRCFPSRRDIASRSMPSAKRRAHALSSPLFGRARSPKS